MKKTIDKISIAKEGDFFLGQVKIVRVAKPGPTIFVVSDGFGLIDAITKDSNYSLDDVVEISGPITERAGRLQIEIKSIKKANKDFSEILEEKSKPIIRPVSINSDRYKIIGVNAAYWKKEKIVE